MNDDETIPRRPPTTSRPTRATPTTNRHDDLRPTTT
jgi:hypothetical protein